MISPTKVQLSLERALEFYAEHNITVPGKPRTRIADKKKNPWGNANAIFFGDTPLGILAEDRFYLDYFAKEVWRQVYNINLSQQSVENIETVLAIKDNEFQIGEMKKLGLNPNSPAIAILSPKGSDTNALIHEIGHHIEVATKSKHPYVSEGIAYYFQYLFLGKVADASKIEGIEDFTCQYVSKLVGQLLEKHRFSERDLFDPDARKEISQLVVEKLIPRGIALYAYDMRRGYRNDMLRELHIQMPEFEPVIGNLTKRSITEAYDSIGAKKFAASIYSQNMDRFLLQFKRWGF